MGRPSLEHNKYGAPVVMRLAAILALSALPALPAHAALQISACEYDQMVAAAVNVIQITDHKVERDQDRCRVTGMVVRSFRGGIEPGTVVQTYFYCGEFASMVEFQHDPVAVARAPVIEIHGQAGGGPAAYGKGLLVLDAPTDEPAYPFTHLNPDGSCRD
jgi:hypothetical protein